VTDPLDGDLVRLLDAERERPGPATATSGRLLDRLDASIGALAGEDPSGGDPGSRGGLGADGAARWMRTLAVGATSMAVGVAGGVALDRSVLSPSSAPRVVYVDRIVPPASVTIAPAATAVETAATATATPSVPSSSTGVVAPAGTGARAPSRDLDLAAERTLLETARTALGRSDPAAALASLERHAQRHPSGQLREERDALAVQTLAALGRTEEARSRADRFRRAYPGSLFLPVVDATVGPPR
jgi:hypothetical protein